MIYSSGKFHVLIISAVFFTAILPLCGAHGQSQPESAVSKEEAYEIAASLFGLDSRNVRRITATCIDSIGKLIIQDSTTPFLAGRLDGRQAWRLKISNIKISSDKVDSNLVDQVAFDFDVYVDANSGTLMYIEGRTTAYDSSFKPLPTAEVVEERMAKRHEKYTNIASEKPVFSFSDVLSSEVIGVPHLAKEIIAHYVVYESENFGGPVPVWVIQLRGLPHSERRSDEEHRPADFLSYLRSIIDANTGKRILTDNMCRP